MRPQSNSFPRKFRSKPPQRPPPPNQQPAFQSNPPPQNPPNMLQNSIPIPAQNGMFNPQAPILFGNPNFPQFVNQAPFLNNPQQNSLLGVPQFGSNLGFAPQLGFPPIQGQFNNPMQDVNQLNNALLQAQFIPQLLNLVLSQNMALQGQQPYFQNQMQNMGQFVPNQTPNPSQFAPHVAPMGCPNPNPLGNMQQSIQIAPGSSSIQNAADGNAQNSSLVGPSQVQGASSSANSQSMPQGNQNSKNLQGRNAGRKASSGSQKPPQANNGKGKSRLANVQNEKGQGDNKAVKSSTAEPKRSIVFTYPEQEIKRWCDERRKNYPTKASVEKKLSGKIADAEAAKAARREQLKEILAKQAELGVEVAEIPSTYLLHSEKKVQGEERETGGRRFQKKVQGEEREKGGRFQKKRNKRRRSNKNQNPNDSAPRNAPPPKKKKPTLLEKLLSADIRRDKSRLLQAFRFMVTNSFFQDPEKPLQYPMVDIEEDGGPGPASDIFEHISDHNNNEKDEEDDQNCDNDVNIQEGDDIQVIDENEEEEGEIID